MRDMPEVLAEVRSLRRRYGSVLALDDVSFAIRSGEVLGFLGPNGAGKTTAMQILTGNLAPTSGEVIIKGHDMATEPKKAKRAIGYLPEQPPLYREHRVDEFLDYCAALRAVPRPGRKAAREAAKERCGLRDSGRRLIGNLSKGYQQRVGLAQAIIHDPEVIILDEPTVGLDPIQIREIRALIRELGKSRAVVLSTHILSEVEAVCDHVQIINKGRLVLNDRIGNVLQRARANAFIVRFRETPDLAAIAALPGVVGAEPAGDGRFRVIHEPDAGPMDAVSRLAMERGWGLQEMSPEHGSLERLFVQLTESGPAS
ncbi:MAG: ATP-binding cassette domain-containing protein [Acidiferrobacteraceae bacterium]